MANSSLQQRRYAQRHEMIRDYDMKLRKSKYKALIVAGLQQVARFLGICALTWATVVLLGGFAASMRTIDFCFVTILLLVEAARLSTTLLFSKLVTIKLVEEEQHPDDFKYEDKQPKMVTAINFLGQFAHLFFAVCSLILACVRFVLSRFEKLKGREGEKNLPPALYIFYIVVLLNSITALLSVSYSLAVRKRIDHSLLSYHDEVFRRALDVGLVEAYDFDFFAFAFRKLGQDYMRNLQPVNVKNDNLDLITYLYRHRKGVEMVCQYLKSDDTFQQQAAANLPGFWAHEAGIDKHKALLSMLADKLDGPGKVASSAANSFSVLANKWSRKVPSPLLAISNARDINVVDIIAGLVLSKVSRLFHFHLRALESFCRSEEVVARIRGTTKGNTTLAELLEADLRDYISARGNLARLQTYAASALHNLRGGNLEAQDREIIAAIDPLQGTFVWDHERKMLDDLRRALGLAAIEWPTDEKFTRRSGENVE